MIIIVLPTDWLIPNVSPDFSNNKKLGLNHLRLKSANTTSALFIILMETFGEVFLVYRESYAQNLLRKKLSAIKKRLRGMFCMAFMAFA